MMAHPPDAGERARSIERSRQHLVAQADQRIDELARHGATWITVMHTREVVRDFIEHALGEGYAAAYLAGLAAGQGRRPVDRDHLVAEADRRLQQLRARRGVLRHADAMDVLALILDLALGARQP
jgi:hypothetical protein